MRVAAGPFFPPALNSVDSYLKLPRASMIDAGIRDNDTILFQTYGFDAVENNWIVVVDNVAGVDSGSWAVKRLVFKEPPLSERDELGNELNWHEPELVLRSHNPQIAPHQLDVKAKLIK